VLKLTRIEANGQGGTWLLEGRLVGPWVDQLRTIHDSRKAGDAFRLDLAGVTWVDGEGIAFLRAIRGRGAVLLNCTSFVEQQLEEV
jgi:hypothetical protein